MSKIAFLVCSHTNPDQVARLVRLLSANDRGASVIVDHSEYDSHLDRERLARIPGVRILDRRHPVEWGDFSFTDIIVGDLRWILDNCDFDWLIFLSGQDYPIRPLPDIEAFLASTPYDGFISGSPVDSLKPRSAREARRRYYYRYFRVPAPLSAIARRLRAWASASGRVDVRSKRLFPVTMKAVPDGSVVYVGFRRIRTPFTPASPCYRGGLSFTLTARSVAAVDRFVANHPKFVRYYRRTRNPDESFFNTILLNEPTLNIFRDDRRYIRFPPEGSPRPDILSIEDLEPMLASGKDFARKFDTRIDSAILDAIDERVHRTSVQGAM
jgi:Core-2/I-Branching enzyme